MSLYTLGELPKSLPEPIATHVDIICGHAPRKLVLGNLYRSDHVTNP